jgi:nicotinate-nucleotide--dimethylbenzimidazole phosphoribosyltransferase
MRLHQDAAARLQPVDEAAARACQARLDVKTKPRGSLGRLEWLACRLAAARGAPAPQRAPHAVLVLAADHGIAAEGVSAYPSEVTGQMVANFARGGAALNVLARQVGARVVVVDVGVAHPVPLPQVSAGTEVWERRLAPGCANSTQGPALSQAQLLDALDVGVEAAWALADAGVGTLALGELGIGNTTAAAALACALTGVSPEAACGRGTGVDDAGLARKVAAVRRALHVNAPRADAPLRALAQVGGLELAALAGAALGAASRRVAVVVDGYIASAALLAAVRAWPALAGYLVAGHRSAEPGHRAVLEALGVEPLLDLGLRLGEGTGAALALSLVDASLALLHDMATFGAAGVTDSGR